MKDTIKKSIFGGVVFFSTIILLSFVYAAVGSTWTNPDSIEGTAGGQLSAANWNKVLANLANLNNTVSGISSPQFLGVAEQNATLTVSNQTFTDIPGATITFNLSSAKKISMKADGSVSVAGGSTLPAGTHCGFRFVIDGTAYGNAAWGDRIVLVSASGWNSWSMQKILDLGAGSHTIKVQMKDRLAGYYSCMNDSQDYDRTRLFVQTLN